MTTSKTDWLPRYISGLFVLFAGFFFGSLPACAQATPDQLNTNHPVKLQNFSHDASELAMQAIGMLGINYKRGGDTPEKGLDCSGLVRYVYKEAWGEILPRTAEEISRIGKTIKARDLQPGDLVFYNTLRRGFSHVGIYLGEHKFIHAPSPGGQVRIENMDLHYWKKRFNGARRISEPEQKLIAAVAPSRSASSGTAFIESTDPTP